MVKSMNWSGVTSLPLPLYFSKHKFQNGSSPKHKTTLVENFAEIELGTVPR